MNQPNLFNPVTSIIFEVANPSIVTQRIYDSVSESTWTSVAAKHGLSADRLDPSYPHERLKSYAAERGLDVIDLLPALRREAAKGQRLYFRRDPHWNRYGHEFAARCIAVELQRLGIATP